MGDVVEDGVDEHAPLLGLREVDNTVVYPMIHSIRRDVIRFIDNPLTYEALTSPDLLYTLVKPLEDKYAEVQREGNKSIVFCFLLNRVHFTRDQSFSSAALSNSRATLCEILAIRALHFHAHDMLELATVITTSWPLFSGADAEVLKRAEQEEDMDLTDRVGNAIEMAILGKAKRFIKSSPCQKVIDGIWSGKCVYQAESSHSILSDTYKRTPIHFYNPHKAPLLDHYRLKVPAVRSVLEYLNFLFLFVFFVLALEASDLEHINVPEALFMVFALGFSLEKIAAIQEHGLKVYINGTWNGFDVIFITIYGSYMALRLWGLYYSELWALELALDCLAVGACLMFPRLAFVTLSNNLMVLSLRSMFVEFAILMLIACFCFCGFWYALWTLSRRVYSIGQIAWWMLDLWFGLDATGFDKATTFHPVFGPLLMVSYACLSNTLLLTVLVSILSHTFSMISSDAAAEAMFRRAVSTIEGVKADALFSYQPPLNLFALVIMLPASYILTPRWFHKVNVFMIRLTSFPILLCIALYERHKKDSGAITFYEHISTAAEHIFDTLPRQLKRMTFFEGFAGAGADIDAVFFIEDEVASGEQDYPIKPGRRPSVGAHQQQSHTSEHSEHSSQHTPRPRTYSQRLHGAADAVAHAVSPLAQVYAPLMVDDDIPEEEAVSGSPSQSASATGVSYGPATRRRLSSMIHRRTADHPFPSSATAMKRAVSGSSGPVNEEQSPAEPDHPLSVGEVDSEEEHLGGGGINLQRRLANMEQRQKRIEDMLIQLTSRR